MCDEELDTPVRSTKRPTKPSRKRCANEENDLIQGLAKSISLRNKQKQTKTNNTYNTTAAFGQFIAESLDEMDPRTRKLVQNQISNLIFQAQMGIPSQPLYGAPQQTTPSATNQFPSTGWLQELQQSINTNTMQQPLNTNTMQQQLNTNAMQQPLNMNSIEQPLNTNGMQQPLNTNAMQQPLNTNTMQPVNGNQQKTKP